MGYRGWRFWDAVTFGRRRRQRALDRSLVDLENELNALPFRPVGISARTPRRLNHRLRDVLIALLVVAGLALAWELRTPDTGLGQNPVADRPWPGAPDDQQADPIGTPPAASARQGRVHLHPGEAERRPRRVRPVPTDSLRHLVGRRA